jgi:hypothetical protein
VPEQQQTWDCRVITLEPGSKRHLNFQQRNQHLLSKVFAGIQGQQISPEERLNSGLATAELLQSDLLKDGMAGCSASHRALWQQVHTRQRGALILEDDCITHPDISLLINRHYPALMAADITFFTVNTNSILASVSPEGLASVHLYEPKHPSHEWIHATLGKTNPEHMRMHRMLKGFGFSAYFLSPTGALRLEKAIFPLSLRTTSVPLISEAMPAIGLDRAGCGAYPLMNAYIFQPFAAYTPNQNSSTQT